MSLMTFVFRIMAGRGDARRDRGLSAPPDIVRHDDIDYAGDGTAEHRLDVYHPKDATGRLPTIVSIHGGGWVYGRKEIYQFYGMDMVRRGFSFVNFNYRLAPRTTYPAPLFDTNAVFAWLADNAAAYHLDPGNVVLVGDSAGAQLAAQYATIASNPAYARRFAFRVPEVKIRALALNCGVYEPLKLMAGRNGRPCGIVRDYFGKHPERLRDEIDVVANLTAAWPPAFVMVSVNDTITPMSDVLVERLRALNLPHVFRAYGQTDRTCGHVFHVDIRKAEAARCNDDEAAFFRTHLRPE